MQRREDIESLSETEREELAAMVAARGAASVSRELGISRTAVSSLIIGRARRGTVALWRLQRDGARAA